MRSEQTTFGSKHAEMELLSGDAEVFDDIGNNATGDIAWMPGERNDAVWTKGVRVMPVTAGIPRVDATNFAKSPLEWPTVERGEFAHGLRGQDKLVPKRGRNGATGLQQHFEVGLGGLLKPQNGFAPITAVRMTTRQKIRLGNPDAVLVPARLDFRKGNYHNRRRIAPRAQSVNAVFGPPSINPSIH